MIEIMSKLRSEPTTVTTTAMNVAGRSCGKITCHSRLQPFAPSSRAASIKSARTLFRPVRYRIMQ